MSSQFPRCSICDAESVPAFATAEYRMYRCSVCKTAFVSPVPSNAELNEFYQKYHLSDDAGGLYDAVESRMQADFPAKLDRILRVTAGKPGRLLDVGCGKGYFIKAANVRGIAAEGIDLSETGIAHAVDQLGVKAMAGDIASKKQELGLFDTVTFWATIEHLPDPVATMLHIRDLLKPGGRLFVDTGIGDDWLDRTLPGVVQWYDPPQHLFVFSLPGLTRALNKAGFDVLEVDPCFDRSCVRKFVRKVRAAVVAIGLRAAAALGRMKPQGFQVTRFPIGNLISAVAVRRE